VTAPDFRSDAALLQAVDVLRDEFGPDGAALAVLTRGLTDAEQARRRTRIRGLLAEVVGVR
jgi:hypothetical protein